MSTLCAAIRFRLVQDLERQNDSRVGPAVDFIKFSLTVLVTALSLPLPLLLPMPQALATILTMPLHFLILWSVSTSCLPSSDSHPPTFLTDPASPFLCTSYGLRTAVPLILNSSLLPSFSLSSQSFSVATKILVAWSASPCSPISVVSSAKPQSPSITSRISLAHPLSPPLSCLSLPFFIILPSTLKCHFMPGVLPFSSAAVFLRCLKSCMTPSW